MATQRVLVLLNGKHQLLTPNQISAGVADAGKIIALNSAGKLDVTMLPDGVGPDTVVAVASETIAQGDWINIYNDGGTLKMRLADAANAYEADGFALDNYAIAEDAVALLDYTNPWVAGRTVGALQYLSNVVPGTATETPLDPDDIANAGHIHQLLGKAKSASEIVFQKHQVVVL